MVGQFWLDQQKKGKENSDSGLDDGDVDYLLNLLARLQDLKKMELLVKDYTKEFYSPSRMRKALNLLPGM